MCVYVCVVVIFLNFYLFKYLHICLFIFDCFRSQLQRAGFSLAVEYRLSCPTACGILVLSPGIEPTSPALKSRFLTSGSPRKPLLFLFLTLFH